MNFILALVTLDRLIRDGAETELPKHAALKGIALLAGLALVFYLITELVYLLGMASLYVQGKATAHLPYWIGLAEEHDRVLGHGWLVLLVAGVISLFISRIRQELSNAKKHNYLLGINTQ